MKILLTASNDFSSFLYSIYFANASKSVCCIIIKPSKDYIKCKY